MKKLQTTLHYMVLILIVAVIIFSTFYMYNKSKIKDEPQYIVQKHNVFHDEVLKITKEMAEKEKLETIETTPEVKKITKIIKPKPEIKKVIKTTQTTKPKPKVLPKKIYDAKALYIKNCKICHGDLTIFTKKTNKNRLDKLFAKNAKELSLIHEKSNVSKMTDKYLKSKEYELQIESIGKYIIQRKKDE